LLARVRALLRRTAPEPHRVHRFGDNEADLDRRVVKHGGNEIRLTPAEYNLLVYFLQNPDRVLSRDVILNAVWGYDSANTRTVDVHVVKLRRKLEPGSGPQRHFLTVHGVGYRFLP
jgi:DNA-binding response OmpR family regulator